MRIGWGMVGGGWTVSDEGIMGGGWWVDGIGWWDGGITG